LDWFSLQPLSKKGKKTKYESSFDAEYLVLKKKNQGH